MVFRWSLRRPAASCGAVALAAALGACGAPDGGAASETPIPGALVFASERDGTRGVYRMDPGAEAERLSAPGLDEVPLAVAPNGGALVVGRSVDVAGVASEQLVVYEADTARALTSPRARARNPAWSPDGRWLVFEADLDGFSDLYRVGRDGTGLTRLTAHPAGNFEPAVAPSGHVVFASSRDGQAEIYRLGAGATEADGPPVRLPASPRDEWGARPSPDGRLVAVLSDARGRDELYVMDPDGVGRRRLNATRDDGGEALWLEGEPAWSPDGRRLAYSTLDRSGHRRIWTVDLASGRHRALTEAGGHDHAPAWSPDSRHLAFVSTRDGNAEIYLMRADGTRPTRLTRSPADDWAPLWLP